MSDQKEKFRSRLIEINQNFFSNEEIDQITSLFQDFSSIVLTEAKDIAFFLDFDKKKTLKLLLLAKNELSNNKMNESNQKDNNSFEVLTVNNNQNYSLIKEEVLFATKKKVKGKNDSYCCSNCNFILSELEKPIDMVKFCPSCKKELQNEEIYRCYGCLSSLDDSGFCTDCGLSKEDDLKKKVSIIFLLQIHSLEQSIYFFNCGSFLADEKLLEKAKKEKWIEKREVKQSDQQDDQFFKKKDLSNIDTNAAYVLQEKDLLNNPLIDSKDYLTNILITRKKAIQEDISACYKELGYTLSEVQKQRIQRILDSLIKELDDVNKKINSRSLNNNSSNNKYFSRTELFNNIKGLVHGELQQLFFASGVPMSLLPHSSSSQLDLACAFFNWVESPSGIGIDSLSDIYRDLFKSYK